MRILIILAQYYPMVNPNVYRWSAIAEHWVARGHEVHVLCTRRSGVADENELKGVQVHRAGHATLLDWAYNLLGSRQRRAEVDADKMQESGWLLRALEWLVDHTWRRFYWPDGSCLWYRPGKQRALALQRQFYFDAMISVSLPFTANRIAAAVKRKFTDVHWLMDIEDPFAFSEEFWVNNFRLYRRKNFRAEAQLLQLADAVSVTVQVAKDRYINCFPNLHLQHKISITPPIINTEQTTDYQHLGTFFTPHTHLAYFGAFYERVRMPDAWLQLLQTLVEKFPDLKERLRIHFFGEISAKAKASFDRFPELRAHLVFHGLVSRETVADAIRQADFLINIGNTTSYHLPSKSAEYMMSGKPIINICQHPEDTFAAFMQDYPFICNLPVYNRNNWYDLAEQLAGFLQKKDVQVPPGHIQRLIQPYTTAAIADAYFRRLS